MTTGQRKTKGAIEGSAFVSGIAGDEFALRSLVLVTDAPLDSLIGGSEEHMPVSEKTVYLSEEETQHTVSACRSVRVGGTN